MRHVTVVSGKGGVGKSNISASLIHLLSSRIGRENIIGLDCDVDAADLHILLGKEGQIIEEYDIESSEKAFVDYDRCISCGKCDVCRFGALKLNEKNQPVIDRYTCEGCGACSVVCPVKAISLQPVKNATVRVMETKYGLLITGQLKMGESGSGKVVNQLKEKVNSLERKARLVIRDGAAGISCPVIASINGSDYVFVVTEPTPTGVSDMERVIDIVNRFGIPYSIIINKHDANPDLTERIARRYGDRVITKIPYDDRVIKAVVNRTPVSEMFPDFSEYLNPVVDKILSLLE